MCKPLSPWERCVSFHGHECGGLAIGYKAALYAMQLLELNRSADEDIVCVAENDACGVDAIQVLLGCSVGKGNLLFRIRGKQAFSVFERGSGKSVRLLLRNPPVGLTREEAFRYYLDSEPSELFDVKETTIRLPEPARVFGSHICDGCGEKTGDNWLKPQGEKMLCLDCAEEYNRFAV